MQGDADAREFAEQGLQQLAVVQLAFTGKKVTVAETAGQSRLGVCQCLGVEYLGGRQGGQLCRGAVEVFFQPIGLGLVLSVPHDERAVLLKKHGLSQLCNQLWPATQAVLAHSNHGRLGDGRLGQGGEHGCRRTCG